jgi:hypothetical protein
LKEAEEIYQQALVGYEKLVVERLYALRTVDRY